MHKDLNVELKLWLIFLIGVVIGILFFGPNAHASEEPMTFERSRIAKEMALDAARGGWSFEYDPAQVGRYSMGYLKRPSTAPKAPMFSLGAGEKFKSFSLKNFGRSLNPVLNQGSCGSCVIFAFTSAVMDLFLIRDLKIDQISTQHYMNCSSGSQCGGAYGEEIADDAVRLGKTGGFYKLSDYPYTATSGRCQVKEGREKIGIIKSWKTIDGSTRSILAALHNGQGVAVGVAANRDFQGYRSGTYNACSSNSINHYVYIEGVDCKGAEDAEGWCALDADGELPPGKGTFRVRNSWGTKWGEDGYITMKISDSRGRRCNGIAAYEGDAQVLDVGIPVPPIGPSEFELDDAQMSLKVTLKPGAPFTSETLKSELQKTMAALSK